ncbi:uncharacterized protein LOC126202945 [Schistocerca nitens]|uniref:uncharacterized protein LOC126202945 n=1 Tax=Schistocerca nitens TaxID=7011 RepID=UPI002117B3FB|nr:uncharacterized protein LOC126202945 [Schistocerca nitens]
MNCKVMKYNISPRMEHLRRKNRYLLQQLETNSELLEKRLKALRQEARTPRPLERVKHLSSASPNRRKYDAWKARNNSKNIACVLGMSREQHTEGSSDEDFTHVRKQGANKSHVTKYATPPSAKKIRRPVLIVSSYKKKKLCQAHGRSPKKHKKQSGSAKKRVFKPCPECYCPGIVLSDESDSENHNCYIRNIFTHKCSKSCRCKIPHSSKLEAKNVGMNHPKKSYGRRVQKGKSVADKDLQSLLNARDMINYSPQSVFLRRLRRQSQSIRNVLFKDTATQTKKGGIVHSAETSDEDGSSSQENIIKQDVKLKKCKCRNKSEQLSAGYGLETPLRKEHPDIVCKRTKVHNYGDQLRITDLGKYRRMHWFDCHAETPDFYARNPRLAFNHNCVHRFVVNSRYRAKPVLEDHEGHSRCEICFLSEPPQPPAAEDFFSYKKPIITSPVLFTESNSCGFTSRQNNDKEGEKDYGEVDYITPSNLYSEAYGGEKKINSAKEETEQTKNAGQGNESRLRGGMDMDIASGQVDVNFARSKKMPSHSKSAKGVGDCDKSLKTLLGSVSAGKTSSECASFFNRPVEKNCMRASHKEQKCPMVRLDKVQSQVPKLKKSIVSVTVPLTNAGSKRLGPFPPKSRVFADPVTIGSGPPVHVVRPPAPVNSLALRYQKGVC